MSPKPSENKFAINQRVIFHRPSGSILNGDVGTVKIPQAGQRNGKPVVKVLFDGGTECNILEEELIADE